MNKRPNFFTQLFTQIAARRRNRQFEAFRQFLDSYHASHSWTLMKCPMCELPATAPDARFCAFCGASMTPSSSKLHPLLHEERNTGPMQQVPGQRFLTYVKEHHQDTGPQTQIHRAVHLHPVRR